MGGSMKKIAFFTVTKAINALTVLILIILGFSNCNAEEKIRIAVGEWPPFISEDLKHYGFAARIITEAFACEGIKVEYDFFPWARSMYYAKNGTFDGTAIWSRKPEREQDFYFSDQVLSTKWVFFHRKDFTFDWKTIDDLKNIPIGATIAYVYGEGFEEAERSGKIDVDRAPHDELNFRKLLAGRIKLFPQEIEAGYAQMQKIFKPEEKEQITHHAKPFKDDPHYLLLSNKLQNNQRLMELFNKGLKKLKDSGKIDQYIKESRAGDYVKK